MHPLINGLLFGLIFIFSIGPGFFALLQTSVQHGFRAAIFLAIGISMSDICFVLLSLFGLSSLLENPDVKFWMGVFGSTVLFTYGVYVWFKIPRVYFNNSGNNNNMANLKYWLKGLVLNGLNPIIVIFWISLISLVSVNHNYDVMDQRYFFLGVLMTIFSADVTKAFLAQRLKNMITPKIIRLFNRGLSFILIGFGIRIVYFLITNY